MRIDHALDFSDFDDWIECCGYLRDLNDLGGKGAAKGIPGLQESAVLALKKFTKRPCALGGKLLVKA